MSIFKETDVEKQKRLEKGKYKYVPVTPLQN